MWLLKVLSGPNGDFSSKRLMALLALLMAGVLSFTNPKEITLISAWLTAMLALVGISAIAKT